MFDQEQNNITWYHAVRFYEKHLPWVILKSDLSWVAQSGVNREEDKWSARPSLDYRGKDFCSTFTFALMTQSSFLDANAVSTNRPVNWMLYKPPPPPARCEQYKQNNKWGMQMSMECAVELLLSHWCRLFYFLYRKMLRMYIVHATGDKKKLACCQGS